MTSYKQNNKRRTENKKKRTPVTILAFTFYLIPKNGAHLIPKFDEFRNTLQQNPCIVQKRCMTSLLHCNNIHQLLFS